MIRPTFIGLIGMIFALSTGLAGCDDAPVKRQSKQMLPYRISCDEAWKLASEYQRRTMAKSQFFAKCRSSLYIAVCRDGAIDFDEKSLCSRNGGTKEYLASPDG